MSIQPAEDIERHYAEADPWGYENNPHDQRRKSELLGLLPDREWGRVLDIGCGNGFVSFDLPGQQVVGLDISAAAIEWARKRQANLAEAEARRFSFHAGSMFDLDSIVAGKFDLVVITGVLYPQYIGGAFSVLQTMVDGFLSENGVVVSCHINEWRPARFPYTLLDVNFYPYRDYMHRLEVYVK
ncbi:class I SAM-dependent methyltransferase [Xylophilus sp. GW821-FHT01B05]